MRAAGEKEFLSIADPSALTPGAEQPRQRAGEIPRARAARRGGGSGPAALRELVLTAGFFDGSPNAQIEARSGHSSPAPRAWSCQETAALAVRRDGTTALPFRMPISI